MGAGAGVATGIVGSMACGPFFFFCAPVLVGGGAVIGVAVGATAGTVVGATLALPKEKADVIVSKLHPRVRKMVTKVMGYPEHAAGQAQPAVRVVSAARQGGERVLI